MRERAKGIKAAVSEIYSPPRVTAATKRLPELKIIPGFALDSTTSDTDGALWDSDLKVMRDRAMKKFKVDLVVLADFCNLSDLADLVVDFIGLVNLANLIDLKFRPRRPL